MKVRRSILAAGAAVVLGPAGAVALPAAASTHSASHTLTLTSAQVKNITAEAAVARQARRHLGQEAADTGPAGREWASFAYDPALHELVLFGGDKGSTVFGDTWTRKDGTWTQQHPAESPSPRTGAAMVYDAATNQLLLFGGSRLIGTGGGFYRNTWVWTGRDWCELHPATSPPGRHNADMIYDAATQNVVLFGGYDGHYLGDTWTWNGTTWTQQRPAIAPAARDTGSFVFDAATGTGVVFGGFNGVTEFLDTWTWNGTTWTQQHPATSPEDIVAWMAAYDAVTQQVLIFGRSGGQTWAWNGTTWTQLFPDTSPPPRNNGSATDDTATNEVVLFGGQSTEHLSTYLKDLWAWNGATWRSVG
jgi:Galactose oxidase, central domain